MAYRATVVRMVMVLGVVGAGVLAAGVTDRGVEARSPARRDWRGKAVATRPPVVPAPTATLSLRPGYPEACPQLADMNVPPADVAAAMEDPAQVFGWNEPANPNVPLSPMNTRRRWLSVRTAGKPYDALHNGLAFKAGCP